MSIVEVKASFSHCIRSVGAGEPVVITRHGKPVAAVVPAEGLAKLEALRAAGPEAGLAGLAGGWEGSDELADVLAKARSEG